MPLWAADREVIMNKITKKLGAAFLAAAVTAGSTAFGAVFAADSSGLESAIVSVRNVISIPADFSEFNSNISTDENGTVYELNWHTEDYNGSVSVTVNEKGNIMSYNIRRSGEYSREDMGFAKLNNAQLLDRAAEWLRNVNPGWMNELPSDKADVSGYGSIHSTNAYLRLNRYVNGISFLNDGVSFDIDKNTGEVKNMSATWTDEKNIPDPSEAMDISKANDEFLKLSPLELIYKSNDGKTAHPAYVLSDSSVIMNARTGEKLINVRPYTRNDAGDTATENMSSGGSGSKQAALTESELENLEQIDGLKSEDELKKAAASLKNTGLDSAEYDGCTYRRSEKFRTYESNDESNENKRETEYIAFLSFTFDKDTDKERHASVMFNAKTGELLSYYSYNIRNSRENNKETNNTKHNEKLAQEQAEAFIGLYSGINTENIKVENCEYNDYNDSYSVTFNRYENGIKFPQDSIGVTVDAKTKRILNYYKSWSKDMKFESADGLISEEKAEDIAKDNLGLELSYSYSYKSEDNSEKVKQSTELAYGIGNHSWQEIDAKTGEIISFDQDGVQTYPTDIEGHYAEKQIKTLIDNGISLVSGDEDFRPDDIITLGDLTAVASSLKTGYFICGSTDKADTLLGFGMLTTNEEYNSKADATRADGVKYIIRALGYRKPAELTGIYKCDFSDSEEIPEDTLGYAALAKGFGIVNGDENGCFNAGNPLTRADAAIMIYNYLSR